MGETLIIDIPYAGLGDHLFHSHLPRIAKQSGKFEKVYVSNTSPVHHPDYKKIVWELNPHLDGFVDEPGIACDLEYLSAQIREDYNLLDEVMAFYGLDDGIRMHEPEIYYTPKYMEKYNKAIYDPNHISYIGAIDKKDVMWYFKKNSLCFDAIMKIRNQNALYISSSSDIFIETPTLPEFCDLIYSCRQLYCLTSGTATLAAALGKKSVVYFGELQGKAFQHSNLHEYVQINKCPRNKFLDIIKQPLKYVKKQLTQVSLIWNPYMLK